MSKEKDSNNKVKNELITLDFLKEQEEQLEREMLIAYLVSKKVEENRSEFHSIVMQLCSLFEDEYGNSCTIRQDVIESSNDKPYDLELMTGNSLSSKEDGNE